MYPCFVILKYLSLKILFLLNDFNSILINYKNKKIKNHKNHSIINRLIVLNKRNTCSWKGQLETFNLESLKLESFCLQWKEPSEIGKNRAKLERTERSGKEPSEVGKNRAKLERTERSWKVSLKLESSG